MNFLIFFFWIPTNLSKLNDRSKRKIALDSTKTHSHAKEWFIERSISTHTIMCRIPINLILWTWHIYTMMLKVECIAFCYSQHIARKWKIFLTFFGRSIVPLYSVWRSLCLTAFSCKHDATNNSSDKKWKENILFDGILNTAVAAVAGAGIQTNFRKTKTWKLKRRMLDKNLGWILLHFRFWFSFFPLLFRRSRCHSQRHEFRTKKKKRIFVMAFTVNF